MPDKLLAISKALSYKLLDPVSDGNADGQKFSSVARLDYINRAIGRLKRNLFDLDEDLAERIFKSNFKIISGKTVTGSEVTLDAAGLGDNIGEIFEVYFTSSVEGSTAKPVKYIKPINYLNTKNGQMDDYYKPDSATDNYFYTIIDNKMKLLPAALGGTVEVITSIGQQKLTNSGTVDIDLPSEYEDLLLTMCSMEAMNDLGDNQALNKYQVYDNYVTKELQLISGKKQYKDFKGSDDRK